MAKYQKVSAGPALCRVAGPYTAFVICLGTSWGYFIVDDNGTCIAGSRRYSLSAPAACEEADERLDELNTA